MRRERDPNVSKGFRAMTEKTLATAQAAEVDEQGGSAPNFRFMRARIALDVLTAGADGPFGSARRADATEYPLGSKRRVLFWRGSSNAPRKAVR